MRILYIAVHSHVSWGAEFWMAKAFKQKGVDVIPIDYRQLRATGGNALIKTTIENLNGAFDIVFLQRADGIPPAVFSNVTQPIVLWSTELLHRRKCIDALLKSDIFSWVFLHTSACMQKVQSTFPHHVKHMSVLNNGTPSEYIHQNPLSKKYFAIFNRTLSFRRRRWLFPSRHMVTIKKGRYGADYFSDLRSSKVALNVHYSSNIDFETGVFEAMASGCVVVSETLPSHTVRDLNMTNAILQVKTPTEMKQALIALQNDPGMLNAYYLKSMDAIQSNTWEKRAEQVLEKLNRILLG